MKLSQYKEVSEHFTESTGVYSEFIHDLSTLYLKVGKDLFTHRRKMNGSYTPAEVIEIFEYELKYDEADESSEEHY